MRTKSQVKGKLSQVRFPPLWPEESKWTGEMFVLGLPLVLFWYQWNPGIKKRPTTPFILNNMGNDRFHRLIQGLQWLTISSRRGISIIKHPGTFRNTHHRDREKTQSVYNNNLISYSNKMDSTHLSKVVTHYRKRIICMQNKSILFHFLSFFYLQ